MTINAILSLQQVLLGQTMTITLILSNRQVFFVSKHRFNADFVNQEVLVGQKHHETLIVSTGRKLAECRRGCDALLDDNH